MSAQVIAFPRPFLRWCAKALGRAPVPTRAGADPTATVAALEAAMAVGADTVVVGASLPILGGLHHQYCRI
jgi:hypothetical protein